jgi:hypothetical protein
MSRRLTEVEKAEQQLKVWTLRVQGKTIRKIAATTKIPLATVQLRLTEAYQSRVSPVRDEMRAFEHDRLDQVIALAMELMDSADADPEIRLKAADRLLKASERRSALGGLDEPTKSIVTTDSTHALSSQDRELVELLAGMSAETESKIKDLRENAAP